MALPKIPQTEHKMFTIDQAKQFLDILDRPDTPIKYKAFFLLAIFGGFRRGEILGIEWNDIDFDTNVIHIRRTVHYSKDLGYYDTEPKSKKSVRALTLTNNVIFAIKQLQNEQLSQRLKLGDQWHETYRLFTTWDGRQMHGATPFSWLTKICEQNNLPKVNLNSFRHLNASLLISSGVDVKTVQSVLGHSQASTLLNFFINNTQNHIYTKIRSLENHAFTLFSRLMIWCGKWDLNPYVKDTRPSNVPVCLFQHCRI